MFAHLSSSGVCSLAFNLSDSFVALSLLLFFNFCPIVFILILIGISSVSISLYGHFLLLLSDAPLAGVLEAMTLHW